MPAPAPSASSYLPDHPLTTSTDSWCALQYAGRPFLPRPAWLPRTAIVLLRPGGGSSTMPRTAVSAPALHCNVAPGPATHVHAPATRPAAYACDVPLFPLLRA